MKERLTKQFIDRLEAKPTGQYEVFDTVLPGFGIRVGRGSKSFVVVKRHPGGPPSRVTLGKYGHLTLDQARTAAQQVLAQITLGTDVNDLKRQRIAATKRSARNDTETLGWLLDQYKTEQLVRFRGAREGTMRSMKDTLNYFGERNLRLLKKEGEGDDAYWIDNGTMTLHSWLDRPFREITDSEILKRFDDFGRARPTRNLKGPLKPIQRTHQIAFKFLSAAYAYIIPKIK